MKKLLNFILIAAFVLMATPLVMFAADTTAVTSTGTDGIIQTIVTWLEVKWPLIGTIGTILFVISEALAGIPAIKANSIYQLIEGILKSAFGKK